MYEDGQPRRLGRRAFLRNGTLLLAAASGLDARSLFAADDEHARLRFGVVTDLHYADKPPAGTRHYRETSAKLAEAAARIAEAEPDFVVELGDLIDAADSREVELGWLKRIDREFAPITKDRHYVLGNHCVTTLTKEEFRGGVEQQASYYSFDRGGFHIVVLDSCFRGDGQPYGRRNFTWTDANVPAAEVEWLEADLRDTEKKTIVLAHQRLDVTNNHGVRNGPAVRRILEHSGKVLAVFQGHSHQNDLEEIGGIHYCTLRAMVEGSGAENNAYAIVDVGSDGTIEVAGFRSQKNHRWERSAAG